VALFSADLGAFAALSGEEVGVAGVGVTPPEMGLESAGQHDMVGVVRVVEYELA